MIEEPSDEFCRAYDALWHAEDNPEPKDDRNAVEATLQRFSDGSTDSDSEDLCFMRELARRLLAAGGKGSPPGARRADAVLKATGLAGKYAHNRAFAQSATVLLGFDGYTKASAIKSAGFSDDAVFTKRKQIDGYLKKQSRIPVSKVWSRAST